MARVVLLSTPTAAAPEALSVLPHEVVAVDSAIDVTDGDVVLVDGRDDLPGARQACLELSARALPILLMADAASLALLSRDWGFGDFVLADASAAELDVRLRMLMTRADDEGVITCGPVVIDESAYTVSLGGAPLDLTYTEFELLKFLALHPGRVLTREHLLSEVWGYDYYGGTRTVDVHVRRLRAKLGPEHDQLIGTVRNVGYRFAPKT